VLFTFVYNAFPQCENCLNQYDPYVILLKKLTFFYPNDDNPISPTSRFIVVISGNIGSQKDAFIRIITADKLGFDASKEFIDKEKDKEGYLQEATNLDAGGILIPPLKDLSGANFLELNINIYAGLTDMDYMKARKLSDSWNVSVSSGVLAPFAGMYAFYIGKKEILKPVDDNWAEAQVFLASMPTKNKIDCGTISFSVPFFSNVNNIKVGDGFNPGDRILENKKTFGIAIMSFKLVNNETIVYAQDYYKKLLEKFTRLAGNNIYADTYLRLMDELMDFRNVGFKDKNDVYASPEAKKQLYYILDLLLAALPIKVDTVKSSANKAPLEVEVILDYFKANITGDKTKNNKFIYDDYIGNDMNRLKLMREIEIIRNYYNMSK
jgi:hypothetical protein